MSDRAQDTGVCLFYLKGGLNPFQQQHTVADTDLDRILEISGVEELTYHKLTRSIVIIYDCELLDAQRLCSCLKRIFPNPQYLHKELSLQDIKNQGAIRHAMERFFEKLDTRVKDRIDRCKDLALILPVGAAIQPIKSCWRSLIAPTWLEFIWALIVL